MIDILRIAKTLLQFLPFLFLVWLNGKTNLKREYRNRQFPMPVLTLLYCALLLVFFSKIGEWVVSFMDWFRGAISWLTAQTAGNAVLSQVVGMLVSGLSALFSKLNPIFLLCLVANFLFLAAHIIVKRILISIFKRVFKKGGFLHQIFAGWFYSYDEHIDRWCVKRQFGQARTYVKTFYIGGVVLSIVAMLASAELFANDLLAVPFYPVFGILILGEVYFFLNGLTRIEQVSLLSGEDDRATKRGDYTLLRAALRKLFGDKLEAENTGFSSQLENSRSNDELIKRMETSDDPIGEAYGLFMRRKAADGLEIDQNYMVSGLDLVRGKSILFNNPFYYDLIPYIFYAMNRALLQHKKVLIVLGRHETEQDLQTWCEKGFMAVTGVPALWRIGVLKQQEQDLDVGILSRSAVQDLALHTANAVFFADVDFVMLIEPSRLITTAQIGLNSIIRYCSDETRKTTFCSTDKNCDGLVDALSHILMTNITEVSATNHHKGTSSYMCWKTDSDLWQHRLLPNITRNLGIGTELSVVALKNQVSKTDWYGGDVFPVLDAHWIAKQYYYDLLRYAELTPSQDKLDEVFRVSPNLWNAKAEKYHYMTVEDESFNLFEIRRTFATRATEQGFVNVISPEYLLREYMVQNENIFSADAKAIPYIVADYARTTRNVVFRLFLRMSVGTVTEAEIRNELRLLDISTDDLRRDLWHELCLCCSPIGGILKDGEREVLRRVVNGKDLLFTDALILLKRKFSFSSGKMENCFYIDDPDFAETILQDLQNADYIAESDQEGRQFLGTELHGQVFQKYLPGQFFTFGGKYYEMLRVTKAGKILVRRAADHIKGRPAYRQVRRYTIRHVTDSSVMGDNITIAGMKIVRQYADICVHTPAYWQLDSYQDFAHGRLTEIANIPDRDYLNKQILRIELPNAGGNLTPAIRHTLTMMFNEIFRTLFAENHGFIAAVGEEDPALPLTYSLSAPGVDTENCIYIIEDSLMDIGLLEAVMRNLNKIFSIACDFLKWHQKAIEESLNPPPAPVPPDFTVDPNAPEDPGEKQPRTKIGKLFKKVSDAIKRFFAAISRFLKKLFKKKEQPDGETEKEPKQKKPKKEKQKKEKQKKEKRHKKDKQPLPDTPQDAPADDVPADSPAPEEQPVAEGSPSEPLPEESDIPVTDGEPMADTTDDTSLDVPPSGEEADAAAEAGDTTVSDTPIEGNETAVSDATAEDDEAEPPVLYSIGYSRKLFSADAPIEGGSLAASSEEQTEEPLAEVPAEPSEESPETPQEESLTEPAGKSSEPSSETPAEPVCVEQPPVDPQPTGNIHFEPDKAQKVSQLPQRKPYHERHFLLFGGTEVPPGLDLTGTGAYLELLGFDGSELEQARNGSNLAELIEKGFDPNKPGGRYCDFCGAELIGSEYEVLSDGRERCNCCSRSAIKTAEEFKKLYQEVLYHMESFFDITIHAAIRVEMVNAKKLHKRLGKSFVPTGNADGRVLGVAIKDKNGYSLLVENGAPRMQSAMTMAHELTHIWQYLHWNTSKIARLYGKKQELEIYEGMAKWVEIQYAYLINEAAAAKREEMITLTRDDEYGNGFKKYLHRYPLSQGTHLMTSTPFENPERPL